MARLGPWPLSRQVAVAVSGGADSLCLAWLAKHWGNPIGLIVDHGLRPDSAAEARFAAAQLASFGMASQILRVAGLVPGPGLAGRARAARYRALAEAAASNGLCDLLLGHHARDQAETVLMREGASSGPSGLAAMPALAERDGLRLVRPLLGTAPGRLRATLAAAGIGWIDDPSNQNPAALRTRLRARLADEEGDGQEVRRLTVRAREAAGQRAAAEARIAATLARRASLFPEGFAVLTPGPIAADCLGVLIRMLGGATHVPDSAALVRRAATPSGGTLGGVRLLEAGRLGPGTLLLREAAAMERPVPAVRGTVWDRRFRLDADGPWPDGLTVGALDADAAGLRHLSDLPHAVLRTLPALRMGGVVCAVPHLVGFRSPGCFTGWTNIGLSMTFRPAIPACGAEWLGDAQAARTHHVA